MVFEGCIVYSRTQTLYDSTYIAVYNVIYTSLPVLALAIFDQVSQKEGLEGKRIPLLF